MAARRLSLRALAPVLALVLLFIVAGPSLGTFLGVTGIFSAPLAEAYGDRMRWYCELIVNPAVPYDAECTPEYVDTGFSPDPNCVTIYDPNVPDRAVGQDCDQHLRALYQQQRDEIQQQIADGYQCQFFTADGKYPDFESWRDGVPGFGPNDPIVTCESPTALAPTCITPQGGKSWCDQRPT